jgi:hypothetical protein
MTSSTAGASAHAPWLAVHYKIGYQSLETAHIALVQEIAKAGDLHGTTGGCGEARRNAE